MWHDEAVVRELAGEEAWRLIRVNSFGRLAVSLQGHTDIFPINYIADGESILFRTGAGTKLVELTISGQVAFEIDGVSDRDAWSVVAKGPAMRIEKQTEIDTADGLTLSPWIPTLKYTFVRITPVEVTGRAFLRAEEPARSLV